MNGTETFNTLFNMSNAAWIHATGQGSNRMWPLVNSPKGLWTGTPLRFQDEYVKKFFAGDVHPPVYVTVTSNRGTTHAMTVLPGGTFNAMCYSPAVYGISHGLTKPDCVRCNRIIRKINRWLAN